MWFIIAAIFFVILQVVAQAIPLFKPLVYKRVNKKGHVRDVPNKWGWLVLGLSFVSLGYGTVKEIYSEKTPEEFAEIGFCPQYSVIGSFNPIIFRSSDSLSKYDSIRLQMIFCNIGKTRAYNLLDSARLITVFNDSSYYGETKTGVFNQKSEILPGQSSKVTQPFTFIIDSSKRKMSRFYYWFRLNYSDDTKKNHVFETIMRIDLERPGKEIFAPSKQEFETLTTRIAKSNAL